MHDEGTTVGHRPHHGPEGRAGAQPGGVRRQVARCAGRATARRAACPRRRCCIAGNAGADHRRAHPATGPRFRLAAAGEPDAPADRGRRARGVPAGQPQRRRRTTPQRCSSSAWSAGMRRMPRASRPGCASTARASIWCWCAGTTSPASSCRCCAGMRHRRASCSTPSTCTTCASAAPPNSRRRRARCAPPMRTRELELGLIAAADTTLVVSEVEARPAARGRARRAMCASCPTCTSVAGAGPAWSQAPTTCCSSAASAIRRMSMRCCGSCARCSR